MSEVVTALESALAEEDGGALRRSAAPKELLVRPKTTRLLRFAAEDWLVIAALWLLMLYTPGQLYPLYALLVAGRLHALGVILHDATHMPMRGKPWSFRLLELLAGIPLATTLDAMRYHHLRHHKDSGMPTDPYFKPQIHGRPLKAVLFWSRSFILLPFWAIRAVVGSVAIFVPKLRTPYARIFLQDRSGKDLADHPEVLACCRAEPMQLAVHLGIAALAVPFPAHVLYLYVIPALITGLLANYRVLVEHVYLPNRDRLPETVIKTTRDHDLDLAGDLVFAPRNIGYHIVHHLHPQVALEHLPALRAWYMSRYPELYGASR